MGQRIFVKVVGFTDVERHALNTVFRLSEQRPVSYAPWDPETPEPPRMWLVDGLHPQAQAEVDAARGEGKPFTWVGPRAPSGAWHLFTRPLAWPDVVMALDEFFVPGPPMEIDLDGDDLDTRPRVVLGPGGPPARALILADDLGERLYVRAKLALALWTLADEAGTPAQALALARERRYALAVVDLPPGSNPWRFIAELRQRQAGLRGIILLAPRPGVLQRVRSKLAGVTLMRKPPHPGRLHEMLRSLRFPPEPA